MFVSDLETLLDEVRLLWHAAVESAERLHEQEPVTLGMRAVLEYLHTHGTAAVPQMARSRLVTRQHIQVLVNSLLESGLVAMAENPAHRRSGLVRLTDVGRRTFERMRRRERGLLEQVRLDRTRDVRRAAETLRAVREALGDAR
jgi:DNA-binding MarR family transcriptional regulator